jgi:DNA-binding transcriptional LysR family regulator
MAVTVRQIEAFRAVVDAGTVNKAARSLEVSQPAVSRLINELETEIGFKLFRRQHGRVARTSEGDALYDVVRRAFIGLEQIETAARSLGSGETGHLRIVAMQNIADRFLLDVISSFGKQYPDVFISLEICSQMQVLDLLASQQYDIGFIMHPCASSAFQMEKFFVEDAVCIMPDGHRLARRPVVQMQDLADEPFIHFPKSAEFRLRIDDVFSIAGVERLNKMEARTNRSICAMVSAGLGVSIVALVDPHKPLQPGITVRQFSPSIPIEVNAVFPAGRFVSMITDRFFEYARKYRDQNIL